MRIIGNDPSTSRQAQIVARGTLPSGKPVVVNADGTVSVVAIESVTQNIGSDVSFTAAGNESNIRVAVDPSTSKVVIAYRNDAASNFGTAVVGTISGESISFGTPVIFASEIAGYQNIVFDSGSGKFVITWNNTGAKAIVGTVSGTTISFGSAVTYTSNLAGDEYQTVSIAPGKIVAVGANGSSVGYAQVGTISDTTISFGAESQFAANIERVKGSQVTYDSTADKIVICYRDNNNAGLGTAVVGTVSGTAITFGSPTVFSSGAYTEGNVVYDSGSGRIVILYAVTTSTLNRAIVGAVSGTSISFGTEVSGLTTTNSVYSWLVFDSNVNKVVFFRLAVGALSADYGTVSGDTISFAGPVTIKTGGNSSGDGIIAAAFDSGTKRVVVGYVRAGDNGTSFILRVPGQAANLTATNYIGMSGGAVKTLNQSQALGTGSIYETGEVSSRAIGYHAAQKKSLLVFRDSGDSSKIKAVLVTASGTTLSFGATVELTGQTGSLGSVVYDSSNEKMVVVFRGNTNYAYAVVATISGDSLTFGTPVVVASISSFPVTATYDSTSQKIVVNYNNKLKVGTVSGTSISFGSETSLSQGLYTSGLVHDPSSNKTVILGYTTLNNGKVWLGTVSGTSISVGSEIAFPVTPAGIYGLFYDPPSGKIGAIVQTGPGPGAGIVATVSGDTVSFGAQVNFQSGINDGSAGYDSRINRFIVACRSIDSPYPGLIRVGTISGDTFSFASPVTFNSGATSSMSVGFDTEQGTSIVAYQDDSASNVAKTVGFQSSGSYVSRGEVADGNTATVDIVGAINKDQSGLTAGQKYYVQTDGTLATTPASPSVLAGTAISPTKLVVKS